MWFMRLAFIPCYCFCYRYYISTVVYYINIRAMKSSHVHIYFRLKDEYDPYSVLTMLLT